MTEWVREIRHGARGLAASPGFTAVAVLSLAVAIGVNTAVLGVARAALLAALAVANPDELRLVGRQRRGGREPDQLQQSA